NVHDERWVSLMPEYLRYQSGDSIIVLYYQWIKRCWGVFKERLNYISTRETIRIIISSIKTLKVHSYPELVHAGSDEYCKTIPFQYYIRSFDGHYTSCARFQDSIEQIREVSRNYVANNTHQIRTWPRIDLDRLQRLEKVISKWKSMQADVL